MMTILCFCTFFLSGAKAQSLETQESLGLGDVKESGFPVANPTARLQALGVLGTNGLLLVPESTNDRVMAFDPITGDLLDPDFIPADPDNLSTPIHAILGPDGATILVSDQLDDVVQAYDMDGNYLGVFAPAGGANTAILDNIRGISLSPSNTLLVSVGGGANADAIAEFDASGNYLGNFVANGAGGVVSPFDILIRAIEGDAMVGGITSDAIHQYDLTGAFLANFAPLDTFPEQLANAANGNLLVANFSGTQEGIVELDAAGGLVGIYNPPSLGGYRGVYELPNGNLLATNGAGVHEIDRSGNLIETKIDSVSARFIEYLAPPILCDPVDIQAIIGGNITVTGTPGCVFDLYDTGCSSNPADWILLASGIVIPESGVVVVPGVTGAPDVCYVATVSGDINQPLNDAVRTVPTLSQWGLIGFMVLLLLAGLFLVRRGRMNKI